MPRAAWQKKSRRLRGFNPNVNPTSAYPYMSIPGAEPNKPADTAKWKKSREMHLRQPNGFDAISTMHVLDALMNVNPNLTIRSGEFTHWMNEHYPALLWTPNVVGRIVANIHGEFALAMGDKNGLLEALPRDRIGAAYVLHYNNETAQLARAVRTDLMRLAEAEVRAQDRQIKRDREDWSVLQDCKSLYPLGD